MHSIVAFCAWHLHWYWFRFLKAQRLDSNFALYRDFVIVYTYFPYNYHNFRNETVIGETTRDFHFTNNSELQPSVLLVIQEHSKVRNPPFPNVEINSA